MTTSIVKKEEKKEAALQTITPMSLLQTANASGASIEQLQQIMELHIKWEENEARKAYNDAMSDFRAECPTIAKTRKSHNAKYAGLAETTETINPVLAKCGLSYSWRTRQDSGTASVSCIVTHKLGHSEETELSAGSDTSGSKNPIQALCSTVSYLERYTLFAILGLASKEMDDDGGKKKEVVTVNDQQLANIDALFTETGTDIEKFCTFMQVCTIADIPSEKYDFVIKQLEGRRK